jgi:protein-glutamine gamma-glutamyltransferase
MIWIAGRQVNPRVLLERWELNEVQQEVLERMAESREAFEYPSEDLLRFELKMRDHLVRSSPALYHSGLAFSVFNDSRANERYWARTELGGFRLREGVPAAVGIVDIFRNGRLYATECATAMVIILYHAVMKSIRPADFERLFADLLLYDWRYDQDLDLRTVRTVTFLPGDILYFENPDHDPEKPQWQGENAVYLGRGMYYGHGAGILTAEGIIDFLNEQRKPGATRSAYLLHQATRPGFAYLFPYDDRRYGSSFGQRYRDAAVRVTAQIGSHYWEW